MVLSLSFLIQTFLNSDRVHMKEESENDNFLMSSLPPRLRLELFAVSSSYMGEDMTQPIEHVRLSPTISFLTP